MGGALSASSSPGKGAVFSFEVQLPAAQAPSPPAVANDPPSARTAVTKTVAAASQAVRPLRVLLAEDHPTNRKVVSLILESIGVDLVCVENGVQAVEEAKLAPFDLILMDMQMPVMDGLAAIRAIRTDERRRGAARMPILCLTANAMPEHAEASRKAGADGHLTKPISAADLVAAVADACEPALPAPPISKAG